MVTLYRAALIGCGRVGTGMDDEVWDHIVKDESWRARPCTHAGNYVLHPRTELVAGADTSQRRVERFGEKWGVESLYTDYTEMLREQSLDIVSLATPCSLHHPMTVAAARAGVKAIFCEKPLASSLAEADEMIRVCDENHVKLVVNHTFHFHPNLPKARMLIEGGVIGELKTIACYFNHWLVHMGTHLFDLLGYFAGEPVSVSGHLAGAPAADADGVGYVRFENGIYALVDGRLKRSPGFLDLMGTEGMIRFGNDPSYTFELWVPPEKASRTARFSLEQRAFPGVPDKEEANGPARGRFVCRTAIDDIVACLDEDRESISSGRDARRAMEIYTGMYHSHQLGGCAVELPNQDRSLYRPEAIPPWVLEAEKAF